MSTDAAAHRGGVPSTATAAGSSAVVTVLLDHGARAYRRAALLRFGLAVFLIGALVVSPIRDVIGASVGIVAVYVVAVAAGLVLAQRPSRLPTVAWASVLADVLVVTIVNLLAVPSAATTWTADDLVTGFVVVPVIAALQLRPWVTGAASVVCLGAAVGVTLATNAWNGDEPAGSIAVRMLAIAIVALAAVLLSVVQRSRVFTIAGLVTDQGRLLGSVLDAEARERSRLAEHLHDGALQYLLAARMEIGELSGDDSEARARIGEAITRATVLLRATVGDLHPVVLSEAGLVAALRRLGDDARAHGIEIAVRVPDALPELPTGTDRVLVDAVREAVGNVVKHAHASRIEIAVVVHDGTVIAEVTDDGAGISASALRERVGSGHIGIASQRLRLEAAGGRFRIARGRSGGTVVTITVPIGR